MTPSTVDELLAGPATPENGQALLDWFENLVGRIGRNDMMIGILPIEEVEKAPAALRRAGECGLAAGWLQLGRWLISPPVGDPRIPEGLQVLLSAAHSGVPGADLEYARAQWFHRREDASNAEQEEAHALVSAAVTRDPDDAESLHLLGLLTCQGFGTPANPSVAVDHQKAAADKGSADAMFELFVHSLTGLGVPADEEEALRHLRKAADAGHPRATYNMGAFHATGQHLPKDPAAAVHWYERAADAGNPRASVNLAVMYANGEGVERNLERARTLLDDAEYLGLDVTSLRETLGLEGGPDD